MTAVTPLLITEQDIDRHNHAVRRTRTIDGKVVVPPTSVKGMLRTEYEMVTGSRFGVFFEHNRRLGYRDSTKNSGDLVPGRIEVTGGRKRFMALLGTRSGRNDTMLAAAWVPRYANAISVPPGVVHGSKVYAWVFEMKRESRRTNGTWVTDFHYWQAASIAADGPPPAAPSTVPGDRIGRRKHLVVSPTPMLIRGYYFHSNQNVDNKHDERIFFDPKLAHTPPAEPECTELDDTVIAGWSDLIASYRDAHDPDDIHHRTDVGGNPVPAERFLQGKQPPAWSWHLALEGAQADELPGLPEGTLCYARYARVDGRYVVTELYPVSLSRRLYEQSPNDMAWKAGLTPAETHDELSPADRLFGWVAPHRAKQDRDASQALRGRLRVGPVTAHGADPEPVDKGLAILGQPRPTQDLFYAARNPDGDPLTASPGYKENQGLRGHKVYPHQPHWDSGNSKHWLLHGNGLDDGVPNVGKQNALLVDRVPAGATLECEIHVENLTEAELGALLFILRGDDDSDRQQRYHKLGGGKPLGFGSVTIELLEARLWPNEFWREYFLLEPDMPDMALSDSDITGAIQAAGLAGTHIDAYRRYLQGFPAKGYVHYPADPGNPDTDENRYEWFVANRRQKRPKALGNLANGYPDLRLPCDFEQ